MTEADAARMADVTAVTAALDEGALARIGAAGRIHISPDVCNEVIEAVTLALELERVSRTYRKRQATMKRLGEQAAELANEVRLVFGPDVLGDTGSDDLISASEIFSQRMLELLDEKKGTPGRKQNRGCDVMILHLAELYRSAGGKPVGDGNFNRFVIALWEELPGDVRRRLAASKTAILNRLKDLRPQFRAPKLGHVVPWGWLKIQGRPID